MPGERERLVAAVVADLAAAGWTVAMGEVDPVETPLGRDLRVALERHLAPASDVPAGIENSIEKVQQPAGWDGLAELLTSDEMVRLALDVCAKATYPGVGQAAEIVDSPTNRRAMRAALRAVAARLSSTPEGGADG